MESPDELEEGPLSDLSENISKSLDDGKLCKHITSLYSKFIMICKYIATILTAAFCFI